MNKKSIFVYIILFIIVLAPLKKNYSFFKSTFPYLKFDMVTITFFESTEESLQLQLETTLSEKWTSFLYFQTREFNGSETNEYLVGLRRYFQQLRHGWFAGIATSSVHLTDKIITGGGLYIETGLSWKLPKNYIFQLSYNLNLVDTTKQQDIRVNYALKIGALF